MSGQLAPLRLPSFRRLVGAYAVNEVGDHFGTVALAVLVYGATSSAWATAALVLCARFLPALFVAPLVARLDHTPLRISLPGLYITEAAVFLALAALATWNFVLPLVLVLALIDGTLATTGRALARGAVANVLEPHGLLREGNALMNHVMSSAYAAGPALAGVAIALSSTGIALAVDGVSFAIAAALLAATAALPMPVVDDEPRWTQRLRDGLRYVRREAPERGALIAAEAVAIAFFTIAIPVEVIYASDSLDAGAAGLGALMGAWGGGMIVGSILFGLARQAPLRTVVVFTTAGIALGYLVMAAAPTLLLACLGAVLGGLGNGGQWVSVLTAVQDGVPDRFQARVVGLLEALASASPGVGYVLGGALAALVGPRAAFLVAGVGSLLVIIPLARAAARTAGSRAPAREVTATPTPASAPAGS